MQSSRTKTTAAALRVGDYLCFSHRVVTKIEQVAEFDRLLIHTRHPKNGSEKVHRWTPRTPVWIGESE